LCEYDDAQCQHDSDERTNDDAIRFHASLLGYFTEGKSNAGFVLTMAALVSSNSRRPSRRLLRYRCSH